MSATAIANVRIRGISPLLMHNGHMADPLNEYAKELKKVSKKRVKTDDDHAAMADIEYMGGLYIGDDGAPVIPGENIEAMLVKAAKSQKSGPKAQSGVWSDGRWPVEFKGPRDPEALMNDENFRDRRMVRVTTSRVARTRPMFRAWKLAFQVEIIRVLVDPDEVRQWLEYAGLAVGLGDYRPKFGRFAVDEFTVT